MGATLTWGIAATPHGEGGPNGQGRGEVRGARHGLIMGGDKAHVNTGSDDGQQCTMNNPCEQSTDGSIFAQKGLSYGQQTYRFYGCMNAAGKLDMNTRGCELLH